MEVLATANGPRDYNTLKNEELRERSKQILTLTDNIKKDLFSIAVHLMYIADRKLYKEDGYYSLGEYSNDVLGYSDTACYRMVNVARNFLTMTSEGKLHSVLMLPDGQDYNMSQLQELTAFPTEYIQVLNQEGVISPTMSKQAIREVIKSKKEEKGLTRKRPSPKVKADGIVTAREIPDNEILCLQRIQESVLPIVTSDKYKFPKELCDLLMTVADKIENILPTLEETKDNTEAC